MAELPFEFKKKPAVIFIGPCGSGKSTVAMRLAGRLGLPFLEGDRFHPARNVEKMTQGIALTDKDRWPWLSALGASINNSAHLHGGVIASCSALKKSYRIKLSQAAGLPLLYAYLDGSRETLITRMQSRTDHYMPLSLLDSQLAILERPLADETALTISIEQDIDSIVDKLVSYLADF